MEAIEIIEDALLAAGYSVPDVEMIIGKFLEEEAEAYIEAMKIVRKIRVFH